ncbi:hypothetical protein F4810DRAFT_564695 [Camillea tinctor]|nr:hypothetical protein F4810DRAFT_564695 [Camillea tinctor]
MPRYHDDTGKGSRREAKEDGMEKKCVRWELEKEEKSPYDIVRTPDSFVARGSKGNAGIDYLPLVSLKSEWFMVVDNAARLIGFEISLVPWFIQLALYSVALPYYAERGKKRKRGKGKKIKKRKSTSVKYCLLSRALFPFSFPNSHSSLSLPLPFLPPTLPPLTRPYRQLACTLQAKRFDRLEGQRGATPKRQEPLPQ